MIQKSLQFGVIRRLMGHKDHYNQSIRPFLQSVAPHTHGVVRFVPPALLPRLQDSQGRFLPLEEAIRRHAHDCTAQQGIDLLNALRCLEERLDGTDFRSLSNVPYELQVGEVVRHTSLGHIGVVAARLPVCLESEDWVLENLGSLDDERLRHPWYLILVARHPGLPPDFLRYGSQLTHERLRQPRSIGFHRCLPVYFKGYDPLLGYVPRRQSIADPEFIAQQQAVPVVALETLPSGARRLETTVGVRCEVQPSPRATEIPTQC